MPASGNKIPNQNNLFDIFKSEVEALSALNEVIIKSKIDKNVAKNIQTAVDVLTDSTQAIFDAVTKMGEFNAAGAEKAMKAIDASGKAIVSIVSAMDTIIDIKRAKIRSARRGVSKLAKFLFGKPRRGLTGKNMGLLSLLEEVGKDKYKNAITNGTKNLEAASKAIKPFNATLVVLGISVIPLALSIVSLKLMAKSVNILLDILKKVASRKKSITEASNVMKLMTGALALFALAIVSIGAVVVMALPFVAAGVAAILGMVGLMILLGSMSKYIEEGARVSKSMAYTITLLGIAAAIMVLVGSLVESSWKQIGMVLLLVAGLTMMFIIIGAASKWIDKGGKELLYIAAVVGILSLVALALVFIGQYIDANWKFLGQILLLIGGLVLAFVIIGVFSKWIDKGGKEMLYIALVVGILSLVALALVFVGQYIDTNWDAILAVGLLMGVMIGMILAIGFAAKQIEKAKQSMIWLILCVVVVGAMIALLAYIANSTDLGALAISATIMIGIVGLVGTLAYVAGTFKDKLKEGIPALLMITLVAGLAAGMMYILASAIEKAEPLELLEAAGIMLAIVGIVGLMCVVAAAQTVNPLFWMGVAAVGTMTAIGFALAGLMKSLAAAKMEFDKSGLKSAEEAAKFLCLPVEAFNMEIDGMSLFDHIDELPNIFSISGYAAKVAALNDIVGSVGNMAITLQKIASLNMPIEWDDKGKPTQFVKMQGTDFRDAMVNAAGILGVASSMFASPEETQPEYVFADGTKAAVKGISMSGLDNIGFWTKYKVRRLADIVNSVGNMAMVLQRIASLNMPDPEKGYNLDGKPLGWKQMKGQDFADAATNAGTILTFFADLFADKPVTRTVGGITFNATATGLAGLDNVSRSMRRKIERLNDIVTSVGNMAVTLQNVASLSIPDPALGYDDKGKPLGYIHMDSTHFQTASENVGLIATTLIGAVASPDLAKKLEDMDSDAAENFEKIMTPMNSIGAVVDMIARLGGGEYVKAWKDDPNNPGQRIPLEYGSFTELLKNDKTIQDNLVKALSIVIGAVSLFETNDTYEEMLDEAEDAIEDLEEVIEGVKSPIDSVLSIVTGPLKDLGDDVLKESTRKITWLLTGPVAVTNTLTTKYDLEKLEDSADIIENIIDTLENPIEIVIGLYNNQINGAGKAEVESYFEMLLSPVRILGDFDITKMMATQKGSLPIFERVVKTMGFVKVDDKSAKNYQTNVKETKGLIKQINDTNLDKLKTANNLMKHIAELSRSIRGDFDGLSEVINENLITAIEELKEQLEKINGGISVSGSSNATPLSAPISKPSGTQSVKEKQEDQRRQQDPFKSVSKDIQNLTSSISDLVSKLNKVMGTNYMNVKDVS